MSGFSEEKLNVMAAEQAESSRRGAGKANWTAHQHAIWVEIVHALVLKGHRPGTTLDRNGTAEMMKEFKERTGVEYTKVQFKNHWDSFKKDWGVWKKLLENTGLGWDADKRTVIAEDEWWTNWLAQEKNAKYARWRQSGLEFQDELDVIFGGSMATGDIARSSAMPSSARSTTSSSGAEWSTTMITPPSFNTMHNHIRNNNKFFPHFKDCIGALDGTHIHAQVPLDVQHIYRGRKGPTTQNVLAVCDFDMRFTFVYAGWEGSANDARILGEAIRNPDLQFPKPPPGKYYLVDAGYANQIGYLAPYKNVKYHLQDFRRTGRARNEKELFNHAHSALRNIIERCFGVLKARFPILTLMAKYDLATQREIVIACMALHNFIRKEQMHDAFEEQYGPGYVGPDPELEETVGTLSAAASSAAAHQVHPSSHRPMDVFRTELSQIIKQRSLSCQLGL